MFRQFRNYLRWKRDKARQAKGEGQYLLNCWANLDLLEELVKKVNSDPDLRVSIITIDGTRIELNTRKDKNRTIDWSRE